MRGGHNAPLHSQSRTTRAIRPPQFPQPWGRLCRPPFFVLHRLPGKAALILRQTYSSSLNPKAMRLMTLILLLMPSSRLVWSGQRQSARMPGR